MVRRRAGRRHLRQGLRDAARGSVEEGGDSVLLCGELGRRRRDIDSVSSRAPDATCRRRRPAGALAQRSGELSPTRGRQDTGCVLQVRRLAAQPGALKIVYQRGLSGTCQPNAAAGWQGRYSRAGTATGLTPSNRRRRAAVWRVGRRADSHHRRDTFANFSQLGGHFNGARRAHVVAVSA